MFDVILRVYLEWQWHQFHIFCCFIQICSWTFHIEKKICIISSFRCCLPAVASAIQEEFFGFWLSWSTARFLLIFVLCYTFHIPHVLVVAMVHVIRSRHLLFISPKLLFIFYSSSFFSISRRMGFGFGGFRFLSFWMEWYETPIFSILLLDYYYTLITFFIFVYSHGFFHVRRENTDACLFQLGLHFLGVLCSTLFLTYTFPQSFSRSFFWIIFDWARENLTLGIHTKRH